MTSPRTLVFLVLVSFYGLTLLSLMAAAEPAASGAALSSGVETVAAKPTLSSTVRYRTVEVDGMKPRLSDAGYFAREEDGAVVAEVWGSLTSSVPTGN